MFIHRRCQMLMLPIVLPLLIILGIFVHLSEPLPYYLGGSKWIKWTKKRKKKLPNFADYECYHGYRIRDNRTEMPMELGLLLKKMGIELGSNKTKQCDENVSCMNYRCQDGNSDDQIVINGCGVAKKEQKCHKSFHKFCERALIGSKVSRMVKDDCTTCYNQKCNVNTELITQPKPGNEKCSDNTFCCYHSFRYDKARPPPNTLNDLMFEWQIEDFEVDIKPIKCYNGEVGCQTYRCKDEKGDDHFVVNGCATETRNCSHDKLDQFCRPPFTIHKCQVCPESGCNADRTERICPSERTTTTESGGGGGNGGGGGGNGGGGGGKTTTASPARKAMPRLNCMVDKICAKKDEKGLVHKLKRRFALFAKMDLQELECWELNERLAKLKVAKKKKKVERFEADFGKAMMTQGPVFVEDFIKAILL